MSDSDPLAPIRAVDPSGELDDVLALPDHLRDALWRVESADLHPHEASGLIVCGMGGSAIGGVLARAALGDQMGRSMTVFRDYEMPPWTPPDRAVLCSSYSGNTEETLACFEAAEAVGAQRVVATTGGALAEAARAADVPVIGVPSGMQPRAAVGYMFTIAAEVGGALRRRSRDSHRHRRRRRPPGGEPRRADRPLGRDRRSDPRRGAADLRLRPDRPRLLSVEDPDQRERQAARVLPQLPELDHNEIVGWDDATAARRSRRSSSRTPTSIRASASAPSSPRS